MRPPLRLPATRPMTSTKPKNAVARVQIVRRPSSESFARSGNHQMKDQPSPFYRGTQEAAKSINKLSPFTTAINLVLRARPATTRRASSRRRAAADVWRAQPDGSSHLGAVEPDRVDADREHGRVQQPEVRRARRGVPRVHVVLRVVLDVDEAVARRGERVDAALRDEARRARARVRAFTRARRGERGGRVRPNTCIGGGRFVGSPPLGRTR